MNLTYVFNFRAYIVMRKADKFFTYTLCEKHPDVKLSKTLN